MCPFCPDLINGSNFRNVNFINPVLNIDPPVDYILLAMNWVLFALISNDRVNLKVLKYFRIITIVSKLFIINRICVI